MWWGGGAAAAPLGVAIALAISVSCDQGSVGSQSTPSPIAGATASPQPIRLVAHTVVALGPHVVAALDCDSQQVAWPTNSQPIADQQVPHRDAIEVVSLSGGTPRVVARSAHGGDLDSPVPITDSWLVYIEYRQHLNTFSADFWYLSSVNLVTKEVRQLASATAGAELNELPRYSASDGRVVWDQFDPSGAPILRLYDFGSAKESTLDLPPGTFPINPVISQNKVVFIDNSTDPNSASEDWLGRRGSLRLFDIPTGQTTTLDQEPTAFMAQIGGSHVVWFGMPAQVKTVPLGGGKVTVIGNYSGIPQTNGSIVVWYDSRALGFLVFGLGDGHVTPLQVADWPDPRGNFALCGSRLYFALSPDLEAGTSTIRYVDLAGITV